MIGPPGGLGMGAPTVQQAPMEPHEAARSIYPSMAKALQKYLKFTKQNGQHTTKHSLASIYDHLTNCLKYDLSPRTFLERFFQFDPAYQQNEIDLFRNCTINNNIINGGNNNNNNLVVSPTTTAPLTISATTMINNTTNNHHPSTMGMQNILAATVQQQQQQHDKNKDIEMAIGTASTNDTSALINSWGLISDVLLSRAIKSGTVFMLRQGDISLLVTVGPIPRLNLTEEIIDPKSNKFLFKINSETSV